MGLIREYYEENGLEGLSSYLIGNIKGVVASRVATDTEKVERIEALLSEYDEVRCPKLFKK